MREIEFRGKRKDNGEWVYGDGYCTYIDENEVKHHDIWNGSSWFEVIPETVGQYIVRKDKRNEKMFSGDIVKNGLSGTWIIQPLEDGAFSLLGIDKEHKDSCYLISALNSKAEVIGNIHDNPELLKGAADE